MESHSSRLGGKSYFSHANPCTFSRPLAIVTLKYTGEHLQVT